MEGGATDLRVPKRRLTVELMLPGSRPRRVEVFLAEHQDHSWHRQEILDLLELPEPFLPAHDPETDGWVLIHRASVVWVAVDQIEPGEDDEDEPLFDYRHRVRIDLTGGLALEGDVLYSAPPEHARVIDHLNAPPRFFRLFTGDRVYLVAKAAVLRLWDGT